MEVRYLETCSSRDRGCARGYENYGDAMDMIFNDKLRSRHKMHLSCMKINLHVRVVQYLLLIRLNRLDTFSIDLEGLQLMLNLLSRY